MKPSDRVMELIGALTKNATSMDWITVILVYLDEQYALTNPKESR